MNWLFRQASVMAPMFAGRSDNDALAQAFARLPSEVASSADPRDRAYIAWCGRWGAFGMPTVRFCTAKYAAALCCTSVAPEVLRQARPPWGAFSVLVPPELGLRMSGHAINFIGVYLDPESTINGAEPHESWVQIPMSVGPESRLYAAYKFSTAALLCGEPSWDDTSLVLEGGGVIKDSADRRSMAMVSRIVASTCMAFAAGNVSRSSAKARSARANSLPTRWEFVARGEVKADTIGYVREFLSGRRRGPVAVQTCVRGHWKHQAHGAGGRERKFIHVEPYWRGPEDAPIVARAHVLGGPEDP